MEFEFIEDIEGKAQIREEFIGFVPLDDMDAATIADSKIDEAQKLGLEKMHGQGHNGCKTISLNSIPGLPDPDPIP